MKFIFSLWSLFLKGVFIINFFEKVYTIVKLIPKGYVATYGQIAIACGNPRASRQVGYALHSNPQPGIIPCHRVVNRFGELSKGFAFGSIDVQKSLLEAEGIKIGEDYKVDLNMYLCPQDILNQGFFIL